MHLLAITDKGVIEVADELWVSSSCGIDDIDPTIARSTIQPITRPLAGIINSSFSTGIVPADIKIAKIIIPLYMYRGWECTINNYRPISILQHFSEYFAKIMHNKPLDYLSKMNLLSHNQYGFLKDHSTF